MHVYSTTPFKFIESKALYIDKNANEISSKIIRDHSWLQFSSHESRNIRGGVSSYKYCNELPAFLANCEMNVRNKGLIPNSQFLIPNS